MQTAMINLFLQNYGDSTEQQKNSEYVFKCYWKKIINSQ